MRDLTAQISIVRAELARSYELSAYEAVDVAWGVIVKAGNTRHEPEELQRVVALLNQINEEAVRNLSMLPGVEAILNIQPPLETILTNTHEHLNEELTANQLNTIRQSRANDPRSALRALAHILKRIRNRRAHGFRTQYDPRDQEILSAAAPVLRAIGEAAINAIDT